MQIQIKKIIRPLDLGTYAKEYEGQTVQVWVNPTLEMIQRERLLDEEMRTRAEAAVTQESAAEFSAWVKGTFEPFLQSWFAELWSQHADPATHWTADELRALETHDPALLHWLNFRTRQMMAEHRRIEKKN